jgi:sialate O-acetylesterase
MRRILLLSLLLLSGRLEADVALSALFQDHLVLQRGRPVPIWGQAAPGEGVTVRFGRQEVSTTATADGRWLVRLDAMEASSTPAPLVVTGKNTLTVNDVVVGEVWLCSGQSNMEWPVSLSDRADAEIAAAKFPLIRQFRVARAVADAPTESLEGAWTTATPDQVGGFTAVGYFFARHLHRKLGVPIGLIHSSWGGTPIEAWMSPAALASDPAFAGVRERWQAVLAEYPSRQAAYEKDLAAWTTEAEAAKAAGKPHLRRKPAPPPGPAHPSTPAGLYHGMIHPLLPVALRGALWYQGESNAGRAAEYQALFPALITHWRAHFGQGDFPFYWVQLANYKAGPPNDLSWPLLREAQGRALALPATGQAVAIDIGDPDDIHPRNKQEVGRRLALLAMVRTYGFTGDDSGPVFAGATRERSALRVRFEHAWTGLIARDKPLQSFEVAGDDRVFYPATAAIEGDTLLVRAPEVRAPVAVRYAWRSAPEANLTNGAGLPAAPFRSDTW